MAQIPYARVTDLGNWVGQTIAPDDPRAIAILKAASIRVRRYIGADVCDEWDDLDTANPTDPVPDVVSSVTVQAAARVWINPQGLTTEANDDYTRRFGDDSKGGLYLTEDEKADLAEFRDTPNGGGLSVISTTRDGDELDQYLAVINSETGTHTSELFPFLPAGQ